MLVRSGARVIGIDVAMSLHREHSMGFAKILCPTDFSAGAEYARRHAIRLATSADAELVIAHTWSLPPALVPPEVLVGSDVMNHVVDRAKDALADVVRATRDAGVIRVQADLRQGTPWAEIVEALTAGAFDLCVIGTHGRTGLARVLLGSVAEKVVRHAPCSVLVVRPGSEPRPFAHVLVPTDFSESSEHALEVATTLVAPDGGITFLHVVDVPLMTVEELSLTDLGRKLVSAAHDKLERTAARVRATRAIPVSTRVRVGPAGAETLAALDERGDLDLVVTGSHGRTGFQRALLGSVAEKVVRHAHCPVLVARKGR